MYSIGSTVFEKWTIARKLGSGSFGAVYEIQYEDFGDTYKAALKVISVPQNESEIDALAAEGMSKENIQQYFYSMVQELVREFAIMAKLKATGNIVSYEDHAVIPHEDGMGWDIQIRMELLTPLLTYAYQHPFARRDVIRLGIDICRALELCQKYNIIHRDIKPDNIFVTENGDFKLGDFGIARTIEKATVELSKKGTYSYMAPEVYTGGSYGFDVDTYSLGIVLYRLLNRNRTPFLPEPPEPITASLRERALVRRLGGDALPVPYYARGRLAEIVLKSCAFDPKDRYDTPMQMRQELEAILYENSDAQLIYPEGDQLSIAENKYISHQDDARTVLENKEDLARTRMGTGHGEEKTQMGIGHKPAKTKKSRKWIAVAAVLVIAAAAVGGGLFLMNSQKNREATYTALLEQAQKTRDTNPEEALGYYLQAQELFPEEESPYISYAYTLYIAGKYDECITYAEDELALGKNFSVESQSQLSEILGAAYFERDDYAAAASFFRLSTAGGDITVAAMRDYAVSLGRLGDISAADEVLQRMFEAGADDDVTAYVQAEIDFAQGIYLEAETGFVQVYANSVKPDLQRRALRSLAELYRDCTALVQTGQSPIESPAMKEVTILTKGISDLGLQYDSTLQEMLAMAWFEAYHAEADAPAEYLETSAETFRRVIELGVQKDYLYRNLYTIYYELEYYDQAESALQEYENVFPDDYMPHALRAMMLITIENEKSQNKRDFSDAYAEFEKAGEMIRSSDDQTYYLQLESLIQQLKDNGWL